MRYGVLLVFLFRFCSLANAQPALVDDVLELARSSLEEIQTNVRDYTSVFVKRERLNGELSEYTYVFLKVRTHKESKGTITQPFSMYMYFLKPSKIKGQEVLYVHGRNGGRATFNDRGMFSPIDLDPANAIVMRQQRYPITEGGIEKRVKKFIAECELARNAEVSVRRSAKMNDRTCMVLQLKLPVKQPDREFHAIQLFIDSELNLPVRYVTYGFPAEGEAEAPILEEYTYTKMKINVGLTDDDFDKANDDYSLTRTPRRRPALPTETPPRDKQVPIVHHDACPCRCVPVRRANALGFARRLRSK